MIAAKLANMKEGRPQVSEKTNKSTSAIALVSQSQAARTMKVSTDSVKRAATVHREGLPELVAAVEAGEVSVSAAVLRCPILRYLSFRTVFACDALLAKLIIREMSG